MHQPARGIKIGAAFVIAQETERTLPSGQMLHAYWEPGFSKTDIDSVLQARHAELTAAGGQAGERRFPLRQVLGAGGPGETVP